ncbi:type II toxin-antitoxin system RelE family toxin [Micromonospora echinospora]|nr:type II toxin-antitoxin system RelE/ParE family toxin [Micromonospora echinospora]
MLTSRAIRVGVTGHPSESTRTPPQRTGPAIGGRGAATETIQRAIAVNQYRVGKPLDEPLDGFHSARRGTYRIVYRINEAERVVEIHSIRHRRDAYRSQGTSSRCTARGRGRCGRDGTILIDCRLGAANSGRRSTSVLSR